MSIMNEEAVLVIALYGFARLLNCPLGSGKTGHVAMKDAAGADLHHNEYVNDTEADSNRDHEITRQKGSGMIAHKCPPALRARTGPWVFGWPVSSDRPWGDADAELQP